MVALLRSSRDRFYVILKGFVLFFLSQKCVYLSINYTTLCDVNKRPKLEMSVSQFRHCEEIHLSL